MNKTGVSQNELEEVKESLDQMKRELAFLDNIKANGQQESVGMETNV